MALGAAGPISAIGYVLDEDWAARNLAAARGFIAASREAKALLRRSDAEWEVLREMTGAKDDATPVALRDRFREGIPDRTLGEEIADTRKASAILPEPSAEQRGGLPATSGPG